MSVVSRPDAGADVTRLFGIERGRLIDLLRSLSPNEWAHATACPGWTVLGLACHLAGDDLGLLARRRDRYFGTPPPAAMGEAEFIAWLDRLQDEWVQAARRLSPELVIDLLSWSGPQLTAVLAAEDPAERSAHVSWAGEGPMPLWLDQVRELSEFWIHRQQLLEAVGRPSDLDPLLLAPIFAGLRWAYPYRLAGLAAEPGAAVVIEVEGEAPATWTLVCRDGGWAFADAADLVVARITMTCDQAWRLLTNNLPATRLGEIRVSGDDRIIGVIMNTRAIIGAPGESAR